MINVGPAVKLLNGRLEAFYVLVSEASAQCRINDRIYLRKGDQYDCKRRRIKSIVVVIQWSFVIFKYCTEYTHHHHASEQANQYCHDIE